MKNLLERLHEIRAARHENRESGFSMIELIVVIAIIGILIAVAIPVYGNIQETAKQNQLKNAAATGASVAAAKIAETGTVVTADLEDTQTDEYTFTVTGDALTGDDAFCVEAVPAGDFAGTAGGPFESGPGC